MTDKQPLLTPLMRRFMFAMVLANIAGSMYSILLPIYLTGLGASVVQVGLISLPAPFGGAQLWERFNPQGSIHHHGHPGTDQRDSHLV